MRQNLLFRQFTLKRAALLAIVAMPWGVLSAQDLNCSILGTQANVRAEGQAELLGDITIQCEAADPGLVAAPWETKQVNIIINLPINVTNNIDFGQGSETVDARLIVNDVPQLSGVRTANKEIAFEGVTVPFPGFFGNQETTVIRISSIRGNVSSLGLPPQGNVIKIEAIVSTEPPSTLNLGLSAVSVGFSRLSLVSDGVDHEITGLQCGEPDSSPVVAEVTIREGYASAWKTQGNPSDAKNTFWESGYYAAGSNNGAGAGNPTMFQVRFFNVPTGVMITLPNSISKEFGFRVEEPLLVTLASESCGALGSSPMVIDGSGNGFAIYKVCSTYPNGRETMTIPVSASWTAGQARVGEAFVAVSYFPLDGSDFASADDPEPRFVDTGSSESFLTISPCGTYLDFPLVSDRDGDSTRVVVANAANPADPADYHYCEVQHTGTDANGGIVASFQTSETVAAGQQLEFGADFGAPDFGISGFPGFKDSLTVLCGFYPGDGTAEIHTVGRGKSESFVANRSPQLRDLVFPLIKDMVYPYVTSSDGRDTELTLEHGYVGNGSGEGSCELVYYGLNAPNPQSIDGLPSGQQAVFKISEGSAAWGVAPAPNFEGYVTASCDIAPSGFARIANDTKNGPKAPALYRFGLQPKAIDSGDAAFDSRLLLPWASARDQFTTELIVTNASLNPFGDIAEGGVCELRYSPGVLNPAPAPQVFPLGAGEQIRFVLADGLASKGIAGAPGFEGKLSVLCDFPRATATALTVKNGKGKSIDTSIAQIAQDVPNLAGPVPFVALAPVLYPGIVSAADVDRGIVLSNGMGAEFGDVTGQESCVLSFEGVMTDGSATPAPAAFAMAPGETIRFLVSEGLAEKNIPPAGGFDGFIKAACDSPLARGFDYRAPLNKKGS